MVIYFIWVLFGFLYKSTNAANTTFQCDNGIVIEQKVKCNGENDCGNWDDECNCGGIPDSLCAKMPCLSGETEIRRIQMCDGRFDCPDLSDECLCDKKTEENDGAFHICDKLLYQSEDNCSVGEIFCLKITGENLCIQGDKLCDGVPDCASGVDESNCGSQPEKSRNRACKRGIFDEQREACLCDGVIELPDGVDEKNCRKFFYCHPDDKNISNPTINKKLPTMFGDQPGLFLDWRRTFDGIKDCENAEDEWHRDFFKCFENWISDSERDRSKQLHQHVSYGFANNCGHHPERTLSSPQYFSKSRVRIGLGWVISLVALFANGVVISKILTTLFKRRGDTNGSWSKKANQIFVLNLSICDFLLGLVLVLYCIQDAISAGNYWKYDSLWRSNVTCIARVCSVLILGQVSLFSLAYMTGLRLFTVLYPFKSVSLKVIAGMIVLSWVIPVCMSFLLFVGGKTAVQIPNLPQVDATMLEKAQVREIVRRADVLNGLYKGNNRSDFPNYMSLEEMEEFMTKINKKFGNWLYFNGYLHSQACTPNLILQIGEPGWKTNAASIFLAIVLYVFVFFSYLIVLMKTRTLLTLSCRKRLNLALRRNESSVNVESGGKSREKEDRSVRTLIFILVMANFLTWFPIALMNILNVFRGDVRTTSAVVAALLLMEVTSATNPFFFSRTLRRTVYFILMTPLKVKSLIVFKKDRSSAPCAKETT